MNLKYYYTERLHMNNCEFLLNEICDKNGWEANDVLIRNFRSYLYAEDYFGIERNYDLLAEYDIMHFDLLPTAPRQMGLLIALWKRAKTNQEVSNISGQVAKPAQALRDLGFDFKADAKKDGTKKCNWTFRRKDGKEAREIIGFSPSGIVSDISWNKLSKKERTILCSVFNEDFLGIKFQAKDAEIDHRMPEIVRKKRGLAPQKLTAEILINGSFDKYFQIVSKKTNNMKREVCNACQNGEDIRLPPCLTLFRYAYKVREDEDNKGCEGCFWYDYLLPKNILDQNCFSVCRQNWDKKLQIIKDKLNK